MRHTPHMRRQLDWTLESAVDCTRQPQAAKLREIGAYHPPPPPSWISFDDSEDSTSALLT